MAKIVVSAFVFCCGGFMLDRYSYVHIPDYTGNLNTDVQRLLQNNGKSATYAHVRRVAAVCEELAGRFGLDRVKCRTSGLLHDISAVMRPADMLAYAEENGWVLCEAERRFPFLLHQRLSVVVAKAHFGITDGDILSAIECHTTLRDSATPYDMVLFIADKIAWDQEGTPPFYDTVTAALEESLEKACCAYMRYMEDSGKLLCPHTNWIAACKWLKKRI